MSSSPSFVMQIYIVVWYAWIGFCVFCDTSHCLSPQLSTQQQKVLPKSFHLILEKPASRQVLERILQFKVLQNIEESIYNLGKLISLSENVGIEDAKNTFLEQFTRKKQVEVFYLANLLGMKEFLKRFNIQGNSLFFIQDYGGSTVKKDLSKFSIGREVSTDQIWSTLQPFQLKEVTLDTHFQIPQVGAMVLDLCGGHGYRLWQFASSFRNSTLVLLDANPTNILNAMELLDQKSAYLLSWGDRVEIKLSDARRGFGGVPYPDQTFNLITLLGYSDAGMSDETLGLILEEVIRVIKHDRGVFVLDSPDRWRFKRIFDQLTRNSRVVIKSYRPHYLDIDSFYQHIFVFHQKKQEDSPKIATDL